MTPAPERPPIYCTSGCDACRDYARELGVRLIVSAAAPVTDAGLDVDALAEAGRMAWAEMGYPIAPWPRHVFTRQAHHYAALSRQAEEETA